MRWHEGTAVIFATPARKAVPAGSLRMEGGQPVRRFTKELIRCGQFVKQSDALQFEVTPALLDHWVKTSSAYLSAGNKIPVPATHTDNPEANRGWVVDVFAEGRSLFGTIDLVGEGIKLAGTCDVSIYSPPELVDGAGNRYVRPIVHVALCTDPVVPGLGGFVPIETSRGSTRETVKVPVLKLQETIMPDPLATPGAGVADAGAATSGDPADAIVQAILDKVESLVKDEGKTAQEKKAAFGDLMKKLEKAMEALKDDEAPEAKASDAEVAASRARAAASAPDPFVVKLARENYTGKLNALVAAGKITPAVRDSLAGQYLADGPLTVALSQKNTGQLDGLIAALDKNATVVALGERTGPQSLALARSTPVGDETKKGREEARKELLAMTARAAGLKPPAA